MTAGRETENGDKMNDKVYYKMVSVSYGDYLFLTQDCTTS